MRWEHGHIEMIVRHGPRLFVDAIKTSNSMLFALLMDLCVPPLALLSLLVATVWASSGVLFLFARLALPLYVSTPVYFRSPDVI